MRDRRKKPLNAALPALLGAVLAAALLCGGCAGRSGEAEGSEASETSENSESSEVSELPEGPFTLPLPAVPAVITEPRDRADYIMEHFFDEMPFADRRLSLDTLENKRKAGHIICKVNFKKFFKKFKQILIINLLQSKGSSHFTMLLHLPE